jgi:hypothetical protein
MEEGNSFRFAEEKFCEMTDFLKNKQSHGLELSELENHIKQDGRELMRRLLIGHFSARGTGDMGLNVIGADGINRTHKRIITRTVKTIFGNIEIKRLGYFGRQLIKLISIRCHALAESYEYILCFTKKSGFIRYQKFI